MRKASTSTHGPKDTSETSREIGTSEARGRRATEPQQRHQHGRALRSFPIYILMSFNMKQNWPARPLIGLVPIHICTHNSRPTRTRRPTKEKRPPTTEERTKKTTTKDVDVAHCCRFSFLALLNVSPQIRSSIRNLLNNSIGRLAPKKRKKVQHGK